MKDANVDFCGAVILLRELVKKNVLTQREAEKVAARIKDNLGAAIIYPL